VVTSLTFKAENYDETFENEEDNNRGKIQDAIDLGDEFELEEDDNQEQDRRVQS